MSTLSTSRGAVAFTILWPEASRLIPLRAQSITIRLTGPDSAERTIPRPITGNQTSTTFLDLTVGDYTATATAYPNADGTGVAQASTALIFTVQRQQTATPTLTMATTIKELSIGAGELCLLLNQEKTVTVTAWDSNRNAVLIDTSQLSFTNSDNSKVQASLSGSLLTLKGVALGSSTLRLEEGESKIASTFTLSCIEGTASAGYLRNGPWPKWGANLLMNSRGVRFSNRLNVRWKLTIPASFPSGGQSTTFAIAQNNMLYASSTEALHWISPEGVIQKTLTGAFVGSTPTLVDDGFLVKYYVPRTFSVGDYYLRYYSDSGDLIREIRTGTQPSGSINITPQRQILLTDYQGELSNLYCFNSNLALQWKLPTTQAFSWGLVTSNSDIYATSQSFSLFDKNIYALTSSGTLRWTAQVDFGVLNFYVSESESIIVASEQGYYLYGFSLSGSRLWKFQVPTTILGFVNVFIEPNNVVIAVTSQKIFVLVDGILTKTIDFPFFIMSIVRLGDGGYFAATEPYGFSDVTPKQIHLLDNNFNILKSQNSEKIKYTAVGECGEIFTVDEKGILTCYD